MLHIPKPSRPANLKMRWFIRSFVRSSVDLGPKWKRHLDCVGLMESTLRFGVAAELGPSGIWYGAGDVLVRSHRIRVGRNSWREANANYVAGKAMGTPHQFGWLTHQCHRLQIRSKIAGPCIGHVLSGRHYTYLRSARHHEFVTVDAGLWCGLQNAIELPHMESVDVPFARANDRGMLLVILRTFRCFLCTLWCELT